MTLTISHQGMPIISPIVPPRPQLTLFGHIGLSIINAMDISTLANLINAIAVTAGVIFAAAQIRQYRQWRQRDAMLELVRSFQSPAFTAALRRVLSLPDGTNPKSFRGCSTD